MPAPSPPFTAIVLAADRAPGDPVAAAAGVVCKALVPVAGRAMLLRVLDALAASEEVAGQLLCGPAATVEHLPELAQRIAAGEVRRETPLNSPSRSTLALLRQLPQGEPVLVTTADHPLLTPALIDHFCRQARRSGCDVVAGVAPYALVAAAYPDSRRTVTRLRDGGYCGCNLFAFLSPGGLLAAEFWQQVEARRKNPLRVVAALGWPTVARYLLGRLTLDEGLKRLSQKMGARAGAVVLPFAEAAVDVDKVEDWHLAEAILAARAKRKFPQVAE